MEPVIEFSHIDVVYPNGYQALFDVNASFEKGEFVFLMGPTGSGKSTLMKLIYRDLVPNKGSVRVNGKELAALKKHDIPLIRRAMGIVFQEPNLISYKTVAENVAYALEVTGCPPREIAIRVRQVLEWVGIADKAPHHPYEVSGGEQEFTSIARALVHDPPIFLADEPTGNLDSASAANVMNLIERINEKGATVIVATHNQEIVEKMKRRVIYMENGKIVSDSGAASVSQALKA